MSEPWFDELAEFLRIPSVSADPAHADDVVRAANWVADFVRGAGGEAEVIDWEGHPLAIGHDAGQGASVGQPGLHHGRGPEEPERVHEDDRDQEADHQQGERQGTTGQPDERLAAAEQSPAHR